MRSALDNLKVLDFSQWVIGPLVGKALADYGAAVVLVESMKKPTFFRAGLPHKDGKPGLNRGGAFTYIQPNKYSISLDMNHSKALEVFKRLVGWADIVIENFAPGVMERWGLGYSSLSQIKPDLIMLRASAQGQTGPMHDYKALGVQLNSLGGYFHFTGWPDREPLSFSFAYGDYFIPWPTIALIVALLDYRERTGKGQLIDLSQFEVGLQFMAPYLMEYCVNGIESTREGNKHPFAVPHNAYPCKGDDEWCTIAIFTDKEWKDFCNVIGNPPWTQEVKFHNFPNRKQNEEELDRFIAEWTINRTPEEVMKLMQEAGVPSGMVKKAQHLYNDPQLNERHFFWKMHHNEIGLVTHMGEPSILSKTPAQPRMPSPLLGEHTEYVCKNILQMTEDEFEDLLIEGTFGL